MNALMAENVRNYKKEDLPDPYLKFIFPEDSESLIKSENEIETDSIKKTDNPVWNKKFM